MFAFGGQLQRSKNTSLLEHDPSEERPFPQTVSEFLLMPERRVFGQEGNSIMLADMTSVSKSSTTEFLKQAAVWFSAFFAPMNVKWIEQKKAHLAPPKGKKRVSYDLMLEKLWKEKAKHEDCYSIVGLTDVDIYDAETEDVIYGRATGDGAGVVSTFHFGGESSSLRCFVSTAVHESLHTFGLDHCDYFACLMSPSCDALDDDTISLFLCPICSRKLHRAIASRTQTEEEWLKKRKEALKEACQQLHFEKDIELLNFEFF